MADLGGKFEGTLVAKEEPKTGKWPSQRFTVKVVNDRGYDNYITLEANEKSMAKLAPAQIGQELSVAYNIRGNKYTDRKTGEEKYFTMLGAWAIDIVGGQVASGTPPAPAQSDGPSLSDYDNMESDEDFDVPF